MKTAKTVEAKDYPSIKAFLRAKRHLRDTREMSSEEFVDTIKGRNCVVAMAKTRGTSDIIREVFHQNSENVSVTVTSKSTSKKASLEICAYRPARKIVTEYSPDGNWGYWTKYQRLN